MHHQMESRPDQISTIANQWLNTLASRMSSTTGPGKGRRLFTPPAVTRRRPRRGLWCQSRAISCNLVQSRAISCSLVQSRAAPAPGPLAGRRCPPGRPRGERGRRAARLQEKVPRRFRDGSEKVPAEAVRSPPVHRHRPCSVSVSRCDTHGPSTDVGAHALAEHTRSIARDLGQAHACRVKAQCDEEKLLPTPLRATLCERALAS